MDEQTYRAAEKDVSQRGGRFGMAAGVFFAAVVLVAAVLGLALLQRDQPDFVVTVHMDAAEFGPAEPIPVNVRMVNHDTEPVRIFTPAVKDMTLEFIVIDEAGHRYEKRVPYRRGMKPGEPPREFMPDESFSTQENLAEGYDLVPGLRYTVKAAYRTLNYPDEPVWFGIRKSVPVEFSVRSE